MSRIDGSRRIQGLETMRLLTYNIHKGVGSDRRYRLERIIDVIQEQEPDLICLQEVDRNVQRSRLPRSAGPHRREARHGRSPLSAQCSQARRRLRQSHLVALALPRRAAGVHPPSPLQTARRNSWLSRRHKDRCIWSTGISACVRRSAAGRSGICSATASFWSPLTCPRSSPAITTTGATRSPSIISADTISVRQPPPSAASAVFRLPCHGLSRQGVLSRRHPRPSCRHRANRLARRASDHLPLVFDFHLANVGELVPETATCPVSCS